MGLYIAIKVRPSCLNKVNANVDLDYGAYVFIIINIYPVCFVISSRLCWSDFVYTRGTRIFIKVANLHVLSVKRTHPWLEHIVYELNVLCVTCFKNYESIFRVVIGLVLVFSVNCCKIIYILMIWKCNFMRCTLIMLYEQFYFKTCAIYFFLLIFFFKKKGKDLKDCWF